MSRREIVLLVSRAIAILTIIPALVELLISLPYRMFTIYQQMNLQGRYPSHPGVNQLPWTLLMASLPRVIALLIIAIFFWRCGPMIERFFLPPGTEVQLDTTQ